MTGREYPNAEFKEKWYDYIDDEFTRREQGFYFYNNGTPTYITGTHYMYLQWSKIDIGAPDFREANRLFFIFWEACKADVQDVTECVILKTDDLDSLLCHQARACQPSYNIFRLLGLEYLSKSGAGCQKRCSQIKLYPISVNYPFFFKPIQDGMDQAEN